MMPTRKSNPTRKAMTVAGIMSGTSADGIDVALVASLRGARRDRRSSCSPITQFPSPALCARRCWLRWMQNRPPPPNSPASTGVSASPTPKPSAQRSAAHPVKLDLIGCHGQTIYHQATPQPYAGRSFACTWQIGEMAHARRRDRRPRRLQLPPRRHGRRRPGRAARSAARLRAVSPSHPRPRAAKPRRHRQPHRDPARRALDRRHRLRHRPGNMVIDALMQTALQQAVRPQRRDRRQRDSPDPRSSDVACSDPFFRRQPPKTAGREQFGATFATAFPEACKAASSKPEDAIATATALTAHSIADRATNDSSCRS